MIRRGLVIGVISLLVLVTLFGALFVALLTTETGLGIVVRGLKPFWPEGLEIEAAEGRVLGPIRIRGLAYVTETFRLEVDESEIDWHLNQLWRERLVVERLELRGVRQETFAAEYEAADEPFELPKRLELPVELLLEDVHIDDLSLSSPNAEPLKIDSVRFGAAWDKDQFSLSDLQVRAPDFSVEGTMTVVPRGKYALEAGIRFTVTPEGYAPMNGTIGVTGNLEVLRLVQEIQAPYGIRVDLELADLFEDPQVTGALHVSAPRLAEIQPNWPAVTLDAQGQLAGDLSNLPIELTAEASAPELGKLQASVIGKLSSEMATIDKLNLTMAGEETRLEATGSLMLSGERPQVELEARWQALAWPLIGEPALASPDGELLVRGHLDEYTIELRGELQVPGYPSGGVTIIGSGNQQSLELSSVETNILEGVVQGAASLRWEPVIAAEFRFEASDLNPAALASQWPGQLKAQLRGRATIEQSKPRIDVEELVASGQLRNYDVRLDAAGRYDSNRFQVSKLLLASGSTRATAKGELGTNSQFAWSISSDDLGSLFPEAAGKITGKGAIEGDLSEPRLSATLSGSGLEYRSDSLQSLELNMDLDFSGVRESYLEAVLEDGRVLDRKLETLTVTLAGRALDHRVQVALDTDVGQAELVANGVLDDSIWNFSLTEANFAYAPFDRWTLRDPASGKVSPQSLKLSTSCWQSGSAELCLGATMSPDERVAEFTLQDLPLGYLGSLLPPDLRIEGFLTGSGDATWEHSDPLPRARVRMKTTASRIVSMRESEEGAAVEFEPGNLDLDLQPGGSVTMQVNLPGQNASGLKAALQLSDGHKELMNRPLDGQALVELRDIDFVADLIPQVDSIEGRIEGDIRVSGSLAAPQLVGKLALSDGVASLTGPEIQLKALSISLAGERDGQITVTAKAQSGGGTLNVTGSARVTAETYAADLKISGEDFRVLNTAEAEILASPDLSLRLSPKAMSVRGEVGVPRADIKVNTVSASAITSSDDQIIVHPEGEGTRTMGPELSAKVKLVLGEKVRFEGFGLEARLAGEVTVVEKPGEPTTASGEIRVAEGRYQAYGQNLDIQRGRLVFAGGPLTQPGLDVRAVRKPTEGVTVGVRAKGTLRQPDFSLFSDPSMSQSEQLAYLVLGRSLGESTSAENSALSKAAIALGMRGGNFLADRFGGALGVDEIGIQSAPGESTEQAALVVGKYLAPKLYVIYGIGLIEPVSTLRLQYALTSKWKLVTESTALQSGGDVIYTIER